MKITNDEVLHVASLARLKLSDEEAKRLETDMAGIIEFADRLNELDTEGVVPTAHAIPMQNAFRADEVKPSFDRREILKNAPDFDEEGFIVPKVVE
ncbi:MAG: Asp-tRNA(Asn)/Glu-tRNA(Gln) amidotransferase subunit GatC [Clostridia bacterium]|nr:Asp-tRNA(Asn)/Glu-tRNA(Gln) amidotransferase subunit GatC [Clostridia bacterium]